MNSSEQRLKHGSVHESGSVDPGGDVTTKSSMSSVLIVDDEAGIRSFLQKGLASRFGLIEVAEDVETANELRKRCHFDLIILETSGIGQSDTEIIDHSDVSLYVMTPEYGAPSQLEKIDMLDFADIIALNKC